MPLATATAARKTKAAVPGALPYSARRKPKGCAPGTAALPGSAARLACGQLVRGCTAGLHYPAGVRAACPWLHRRFALPGWRAGSLSEARYNPPSVRLIHAAAIVHTAIEQPTGYNPLTSRAHLANDRAPNSPSCREAGEYLVRFARGAAHIRARCRAAPARRQFLAPVPSGY